MHYLSINLHELFLSLVGICLLLVALILVVIIISFVKYRDIIRHNFWGSIIDQKVTDAIIHEAIDDTQKGAFEKFLNVQAFRDLCIQKMIEAEKKFSGSIHAVIQAFYTKYAFKADSLKKMTFRKAFTVARGIQESTAMHADEALPSIEQFLKHKDPNVYEEAQYAMVTFKGFEGLQFLSNFKNILSDWQQLRLLRSIHELPEDKRDLVSEWMSSENHSVALFALRLAGQFQTIGLYSEVVSLLIHPEDEVRIQALKTLQVLENENTLDDIIQNFEDNNIDVQMEVIRLIKSLNDPKSLTFLKDQLLNSRSVSLKIAVAELLYTFREQAYLREVALFDSSDEELALIINHALQEKIC